MPPFPEGEPGFVELLRSHVPFVRKWNADVDVPAGYLSVLPGIRVDNSFPDPENLLETVLSDFDRFLHEAEVAGDGVDLIIRYTAGYEYEEYHINICADNIVLTGSDTEGIRRGIYHLQDMISSSPFLKYNLICRKPWLKNRISRCFFGPIKRPPFNIDELMNDIDYYPEEYLNRLAHDGVNGLWLTVAFRDICDTSVRKASADAARRIAKLRRTVNSCRRYGIKIWIFAIEPIYWSTENGNILPPGCEKFAGPGYKLASAGLSMDSFCPNSPEAAQYLYECTNSLFTSVPHLGGLLLISHGERVTSCLSFADVFSEGDIPCKNHCGKSNSEILAMTIEPMKRGMKDAAPDAELISWLYVAHAEQVNNWVSRLPENLPDDIALAFNFESGITKKQLGKVRCGGDYWLSVTGPSDRFNTIARATQGHCDMAAKLQVGCSHECATVPYIPVPGILYRKYRKMRELGVSHVIQCWYFGNFPGVMNKAAGKLAFEDFQTSEKEFLSELAAPQWNSADVPVVTESWQQFADAYDNYPLDMMFQYYGTVHDGTVWPLHLKRVNTSLTRSWKPELFPAGDAIGECMEHFTLDELSLLTKKLSEKWHAGLNILQKASRKGNELEFTLAEALNIMFASGHNILKFYSLRHLLVSEPSDADKILVRMKTIVNEEIEHSLRLAELCCKDPRLGYHSEAEVYKYFPEKLLWRAECLRSLLSDDFPQAEKVLATGGSIRDFIADGEIPAEAGKLYGANDIMWGFTADADNVVFRIDFGGNINVPETVSLMFADEDCVSKIPEVLCIQKHIDRKQDFASVKTWDTADGWSAEVVVPREYFNYQKCFRFGILREYFINGKCESIVAKAGSYHSNEVRLRLGNSDPQKMVLIRID